MGNNMITGKNYDTIQVDKDNPYYLQVKKKKEEMSGWERVQFAFTMDELGNFSPEMYRVKDATMMGLIVGGFLGAFGRSKIAYMDFFKNNTATQFESPLQARRVLQDQVILGMGSGAFRLGWRIGAFTFMYMTGATIIAAYRGKYGVIDQVGGAGTAGFLYKLRDGPKAAVSGTVFGSLLGLCAGTLSLIAVSLFGLDIESANREYYTNLDKRLDREREYTRKARENLIKNDAGDPQSDDKTGVLSLAMLHDTFVAQMEEERKAKAEANQNAEKQVSNSPNPSSPAKSSSDPPKKDPAGQVAKAS